MPKFEQFGLNAESRLNESISNVSTSLDVVSATRFPTDGNFRIVIGTEIILVTAVSTNTFTITRGVEGTTAQTHDAGSRVSQILTAGGIEQLTKDSMVLFQDTSRPVMNTIVNSSGTALTESSFTWDNQGTATATDLNSGGISLVAPTATGESLRVKYRTADAAPYTLKAAFMPQLHSDNSPQCGIGFRQNSTGKLFTIGTVEVDKIKISKYTTSTSLNSTLLAEQSWPMARNLQWFQIEDDNTDLIFYTGIDGVNWQEVGRETRTTFMTGGPDQVCFYANSNSTSYTVSMALVAWEEA